MNRSVILIIILCFLPFHFSQSANTQSTIAGQVTDSLGAVLANTRVLIHWDPSGSAVGLKDNIGVQQDVIVVTDVDGKYSADVPPGFYDLFVTRMAFSPASAKVRIKQGQRTVFNAKLKVDPQVTKELAH
jgi:hypothetical protein